MARLRRRDRYFDFELVVAELLDALAAVHQRSSGAYVVLAPHLALLPDGLVGQLLHAALLVGQALVAQLGERLLGLAQLEAHSAEDAGGLRELDLVVLHDLDAVAARVANVEEAARKHLDSCFLERTASRLLVVHDEPEMRLLGARPSFEQGEELVPYAKKRGARYAGDRCGLEEVGVEGDRLLDVVDLERDVVDPNETWLHAAANDGAAGGMPVGWG